MGPPIYGSAFAVMFLGIALVQTTIEASIRMGAILPVGTKPAYLDAPIYEAVAEAARMGTTMAKEKYGFNVETLRMGLDVLTATAPDADAVLEAAQQLISTEEIFVLFGGFGKQQALALSQLTEERQALFLDLSSPSNAAQVEDIGKWRT